MRSLIIGGSVVDRQRAVADGLDGEAGVLLLAPSRGAADDLLLTALPDGVFGVERRTPFGLALELAAPTLQGAPPVTALGTEAVASLVTARALQAGDLSELAEVARMPGFPRALAATLRDVRLAEVGAAALDRVGAAELGRLLRRFEDELAAWRLADEPRVLAAACERLGQGTARYAGWSCVLFDLEVRSRGMDRFLERLLAQFGSAVAAAGRGDVDSAASLRRILEQSGEGTLQLVDLDAQPGAGSPTPPLRRAQRDLFATDVGVDAGASADEEVAGDRQDMAPQTVTLFSAAAEGQECVEIARRVRDLARRGVPFDRMAVVVRDATSYMPLLEDAMRRASVPTWFSRGTARPDPAGRAFLSLLACATEDLSATRFSEYLSLAQVPRLAKSELSAMAVPWVAPRQESLFPELGAEDEVVSAPGDAASERETGGETEADERRRSTVPVPARWERILVDAAVVGGIDRWRRRLAGRRGELGLVLRQIGDEERARRAALELELRQLGYLEAFALPLVEILEELPERATWGEWLAHLESLAAATLRHPETVLVLLAELRPMAEVGPVSLLQVQQVLTERLSMLRRQPAQRRYGAVFVGLIEELAGRSFDAVFLPGMAEGVFPRRTFDDPLLPDERRRPLSEHLSTQRQRLAGERLLLHRCVEAASDYLVVSYPRVDAARGRARVPSFYALDLLRAAEGGLPDLRAISRRAASASRSAVGWAVPQRCEDAIDDAEFDLALLRPLLQADEGAAGHGRFLLLSNAHLERSLRARARRWRRPFTVADGLVVDEGSPALPVLEKHHPRARSFSPTALQHFSACPYRFYLQAVMRLRPRDEIERLEELDPLTRGSIFHELQFELLSRLREAEELPVTLDNLGLALDHLDRVVDALIPAFAEDLAPAIERVWLTETDGIRNDLRGWISQMAQQSGRWTPRHFELAFGLRSDDARDPASVAEPVQVMAGIQLRGAIDMVEIDGAGERLRVTDHKTGVARVSGRLVVGHGEVLQPVLYALAAESLLGDETLEVAGGRLSYCTQRGGYEEVVVPLDPESRAAAERVLDTVAESLETGFLPALPRQDACRWCDYQSVCGPYEELRARGKDWRQPLARRLLEVRRLD